ncbi:MAG TPA: amino acid permease, partial [Polyangiales bacterium]|nr:amino acid permease [Polyangiales bacterium]
MSLSDVLLGKPIATDESTEERVSSLTGVPVLGLDALASAAYGPEALLTVLLPLGTLALRPMLPLTGAIALLLLIVFGSYRQTIAAYPNGGGAYTVAKENLGRSAALCAAAALALDYVLNVAVAIAAGVGALVSAIPNLLPHTLSLCLVALALLTAINLRGVRATGLALMLPTALFMTTLLALIAIGTIKTISHAGHPPPVLAPTHLQSVLPAASLWLLLRAFASGCAAMTGIEAVSNAVPIFREPNVVRARRTLGLIIGGLLLLLIGEAFLCYTYRVTATPPGQNGYQSVLSQLTAAVVGRGPFYFVTIGSVAAVLGLSANTSF